MEPLFRILIVAVLIGIVVSLGSALFHLSRGHGDSKKMVRALTVRVGLSLALFALLMIAWFSGVMTPHDVEAPRTDRSPPPAQPAAPTPAR